MKAFRTCPLCEANCGLELEVSDSGVQRVRGDAADVFSRGFLCPKGVSIKDLHEDPDRLRTPLVHGREATWDEAFALIDAKLTPLLAEHGRDAVAVYLGNPTAHSLGSLMYGRPLLKALRTKNLFSASTVDQMPKQVSAGLMFGTALSVPVPDIDRTDYLLMLGANPMVSNGSLMTAPDMRGRVRALLKRGGRLVVLDPRVSRTAEEASEHLFIRPGTDALFLFALLHVLAREERVDPGVRLAPHLSGLDEAVALAQPFSPEAVAPVCGIAAADVERIAFELAAAPRAAVYGRIGTCTQEFGTLASWLVDVLNAATGNLDREGGAMFARGAAGAANTSGAGGQGKGFVPGRWTSRVRGAAEVFGELPVACLAEEIDTPGEGRVRALITHAGNPVLSTPDGARLERAIESLDFMVSIDIYLNETTRHADVVLPVPSQLAKPHYALALYQLAVHNVANYSPPVFDSAGGEEPPEEWRTLLRLTGVVAGAGPDVDVEGLDRLVAAEVVRRETALPGSPVQGRDPDELLAELEPRVGPERILDFMLRVGPYDLTLADLEAAPHGIDLGPLQPRLPEVLRTPTGRAEMAPPQIVADVPRLRAALERTPNGEVVLIGRRQLRSNNSWMHNIDKLVRGPARCTLHVHPVDAERLGLTDGSEATVRSATGEVRAPVEVTDKIMPGVVSIPHGWGHAAPGARMAVAAEHAGVNCNLLTGTAELEPLSGNAILNGVPVVVAPVRSLVVSR